MHITRLDTARAAMGAVAVTAIVGLASACSAPPAAAAEDLVVASTVPPAQTVLFTGAPQTVTVPSGATSVTLTVTGGSGGVGQDDSGTTCDSVAGGNGATVTGTAAVTADQQIQVAVGGVGATDCGHGASDGGWGGLGAAGGDGRNGYSGAGASGGGGGASTVQIDGTTVIIAGGGGGGASDGIGGNGGHGGTGGDPAG
ncbi:hypothetical protein KDL28_15595, partial [Pseudonocardia sp. S2-4]|nr:hypothetical protein [Pseudonocardia humida]